MNLINKQMIAEERVALRARLAKLDELEALAQELYPTGAVSSVAAQGELRPAPARVQGTGTVTKKTRILDTAEEILSDGRRRTATELVAALAERGVIVGGADPNNNLGAYLSPSDRFDSDRKKGGWGLARSPKKASPADVGASAGLFNGSSHPHA